MQRLSKDAGISPPRGTPDLLDRRFAEALRHPTRSKALLIFSERGASAKEVADEIGIPPNLAGHHVNRLLDLGCIEEVETKKRRGATERFFRSTVRHFFDNAAWASVPKDDRFGILTGVVEMISEDLGEGMQSEGFTADDTHLSRTPMKLDRAGWNEVTALLEQTLERLLTIREVAAVRLAETDQEAIVATVSILGYDKSPRKKT